MSSAGRGCLGCVALFVVSASVPAGVVVYQSARACAPVHEAQAFCDELVPRLEAARRAAGAYPQTLVAILLPGESLPPLLRLPENAEWYESDGASFFFRLYSDGGRFAFLCAELHAFDSRTATWGVSTG